MYGECIIYISGQTVVSQFMWIQKQIYCVLWKISSLSICPHSHRAQQRTGRQADRHTHLTQFRFSAESQCECAHSVVRKLYLQTIKSCLPTHSGDKYLHFYIAFSRFFFFYGPNANADTGGPLHLYGIINLIKIRRRRGRRRRRRRSRGEKNP